MALQFRPYDNPEPTGAEYAQQWGKQINQIGDTFSQGMQQQLALKRQAMLDQYLKQKQSMEQQQFGMEKQKFASDYGTPIDPTIQAQPMRSLFTNTPQGRQTQQVPGGQASPLIQQFNDWRSKGMPKGGARPEFMSALGKDERKTFQDMNSPETQAGIRLKDAQADYYSNRPATNSQKDFYFIEPGSRKMFDSNLNPIDVAPPGATPRMLTNPGDSTEGTKRSGLVSGLQNSVSKFKELMTPQVLAELKAIRFTPGKIYSQIGSSEAKRAFSHLKNAIANELYIKSGATANPGELEEKALMYLPAGNDSLEDVFYRADMLANEGSYFDMSGGGSPNPGSSPNPGGQGGLMWNGRPLKDTPANRAWLQQQQGGGQ